MEIKIMSVCEEVWRSPDSGAAIGLVSIDVHDGYLDLDVVYSDWPVDDPPERWRVLDATSGAPLASGGGGGGGGYLPGDRVARFRFNWAFTFLKRPNEVRIVNSSETVDVTVQLTAAAPQQFEETFRFETPDKRRVRACRDALASTGFALDLVPDRVDAVIGDAIDSPLGVVRPVALERWRGADVLRVWSTDGREAAAAKALLVRWSRTGATDAMGVDGASRSGLGGGWTQLAFPIAVVAN